MKYFILLLLFSCSTLERSQITGAVAGGITCGIFGSFIGKSLSPNEASESANKLIGFGSGASTCSLAGYYLGGTLYKSDPKNIEGEEIQFKEALKKEVKQELLNTDLGGVSFSDFVYESEEAEIPLVKTLPSALKDKVQRQKLIHYKITPQTIKTKDGRTLYFSGGEAIEHQFIQN